MNRIIKFLQSARKAVVASATAFVVTGTAFEDGVISGEEWLAVIAAWAGVFGVYQVANLVGAVNRKR